MNAPEPKFAAAPLEPMMREAGKIALGYFGSVTREHKSDDSPVSAADREVESFIVRELETRFPAHTIVGEEYGTSGGENGRYTWAIDPIDGTAGFLSQLPTWTICVGLLVDAVPVVGLVYHPCTGELFTADPDAGARLNDRPIRVAETELGKDCTLLVTSFTHRDIKSNWPYRMWALSSAANSVAYTAKGGVTGGVLDRVHSYDIAAATAILNGAGGEIVYLHSGKTVDFSTFLTQGRAEDHMVCAHPSLTPAIRSYLELRKDGE